MVDIPTDILSPYLAITAMFWNIHFDCTQIQQLIYSRIITGYRRNHRVTTQLQLINIIVIIIKKPQYQTVSYTHADSHTIQQCCNVSKVTRAVRDSGVARNLFQGGSTTSVEDRGQIERGSGGGSPLVRGSDQFANG
jgi:hypothetical protein